MSSVSPELENEFYKLNRTSIVHDDIPFNITTKYQIDFHNISRTNKNHLSITSLTIEFLIHSRNYNHIQPLILTTMLIIQLPQRYHILASIPFSLTMKISLQTNCHKTLINIEFLRQIISTNFSLHEFTHKTLST